ncbi:hypothetical protein MM182_13605 [Aeromonas sp. MR19]|uniref:hypothetical protein n=1 Tax=Aeromonas sp. MR19 TaxID=2923421 RepID=UPI001F4A6A32|nr:hypothetical protein [Aeromonas sp. MR19]MCH7376400.1 hypothetical protein [Aeromonas sp. MR19]
MANRTLALIQVMMSIRTSVVYGKCAIVFTVTTTGPFTLLAGVPAHSALGSGNTRTTYYVIKVSYVYENKQGEPDGSPCGYTITQAGR